MKNDDDDRDVRAEQVTIPDLLELLLDAEEDDEVTAVETPAQLRKPTPVPFRRVRPD